MFVERLEDRSLPSVGLMSIPGSSLPVPNPGPTDAASGDNVLPNPIPFAQKLLPPTRQYGPFHFMFPGPADQGHEPSLITDFNGFIGVAMFKGTGTDGAGNAHTFSGDMRFMKGEYVGVDGKNHQGAFAFI
jgi:hypothetical protein